MIAFRHAAILLSVICAALFVIFLVFPAQYMATYGIASSEGAAFMSRRVSPMVLGLAVLFWYARNLRMSPGREAIRLAVIISFGGIALTGIGEFLVGHASWTILVAAMSELVIAGVFLWGIRAD